ncbi:MAG: DUF4406 domain-containing protein [Candidatus Neomarinimicrobiota bacterium]
MTIFISGPISNNPDYIEQFKTAQDNLEEQGYIVLNPTCLNPELSYGDLMTICRTMIDVSDAVYMLRNWTISPGACDENTYAMVQNKQIIYEE